MEHNDTMPQTTERMTFCGGIYVPYDVSYEPLTFPPTRAELAEQQRINQSQES